MLLNVSFWVTLTPKRAINVSTLLQGNTVSMDVQFNECESYFPKDVDMVPLQGEINSKEEERLRLEEKRWWISSKGEDLELDDS